ncbi:MAG: membrane protein insertase YidC [Evtepia sp.]|uniref:membrane protein insertase YidC n=1 Tax=Evtepia sp. TaxID=2773933 RepID=UPI002A752E11|nr:membrane protein insertase YidC [Evtepia sp.]MDY3014313.1 membrane protein insertase YidC [Evtepia sp.]
MNIILTPFAKLVLLFYNVTGSYGVSLILFGLVIRLILFPVFLKGRKGMMGMSSLAEKQKVLQQKYAKDRTRYSQELQKLYEQEGVKPSSGCLWSFLPLPFLMVLYAIVRQPLTYLMGMTEDQFNSVSNLLYGNVLSYQNQQLQMAQDVFLNHDKIVSAIPELANMPQIDFTFLGINLSQTPSLFFWKEENLLPTFGLFLVPVLSALLSVVSMIVTNKINAKVLHTNRVVDQSAKMTMVIMPLVSLWLCFTLPGALGVYWIANSLFAIMQEFMNIPFLTKFIKKQEEERLRRQEEEKERLKQEKKLQAEAKRKAAEEMRRIQMERKLNKSIATASREGMRTYARGRLYDPDRYPTFPYRDPNEIAKEEWEQKQKEAEERKNKKKGKKDGSPAPAETPVSTETPVAETKEAAAQEETQEAAAVTQVPVSSQPVQPAEPEEEEEGFVEESFLEEPEEENEEK